MFIGSGIYFISDVMIHPLFLRRQSFFFRNREYDVKMSLIDFNRHFPHWSLLSLFMYR